MSLSRFARLDVPHGSSLRPIGPSEAESHGEHRAALDATLFREARETREWVFELESGQLRLRDLGR